MYQQAAYPIFLYAPMVGVIILSILIAFVMKNRPTVNTTEHGAKRRRRKEQQAVRQLFLIVCSFLLGYLPYIGKIFTRRQISNLKSFNIFHYLGFVKNQMRVTIAALIINIYS